MGSVKDLIVKKPATETEMGLGVFKFTDDYSVFDYGKMPDKIPNKGEALCSMAAFNFKHLAEMGVKNHFVSQPALNEMEVKLVRVLYPQKNEISENTRNYLVPLEIMFRNSLPEGSSVFKRLKSGQLTPADLGLDEMPEPGIKLEEPFFDVSTKLEELTDRYLSWKEAREMSKLSEEQMSELKEKVLKINSFLSKRAEEIGLEHADGKAEFGLNPENELILVDVAGTLDENRFLFNKVHISKQVIRDYYKTIPWAEEVSKAKDAKKPKEEWPAPPKLPPQLVEIVSNMYKSVAEAWIGKKTWDAPSIEETMNSYDKFLKGVGK